MGPKPKAYVGNDGQWMAVTFSFVKGAKNTKKRDLGQSGDSFYNNTKL